MIFSPSPVSAPHFFPFNRCSDTHRDAAFSREPLNLVCGGGEMGGGGENTDAVSWVLIIL